jgi:hypothetical protein
MTWNMTWNDNGMIWYEISWYNNYYMIWYNIIWYTIWCDRLRYDRDALDIFSDNGCDSRHKVADTYCRTLGLVIEWNFVKVRPLEEILISWFEKSKYEMYYV